jgi:signal transduction histidine kinase
MTIRLRLTLLYGGLFLVAGALLLGITYLLVAQSVAGIPGKADPILGGKAGIDPGTGMQRVQLSDGRVVGIDQLAQVIREQQEQFQSATLSTFLTQGGIALGVVGAAALGSGWVIAGRALHPIGQITATANRVAAAGSTHSRLHERIGLRGPSDELKQLADTFDDMLDRLDRAFDGQRRFVANASHELRTPLAINRALLEVAATRPDAAPELRQLADTLLAVNVRNERLIEGLLTLAETENELTEKRPVDLADVVEHVLEQTDVCGLEVRAAPRDTAPVLGDPVLLERMVHNLIDNAVRHNVPDGWLSVSTVRDAANATVAVSSSGPPVAPYEAGVIFEPFRRLGGERQAGKQGAGLGLSIVRAVARAHGGDATGVPIEGGGLTVTITIPAAATDAQAR